MIRLKNFIAESVDVFIMLSGLVFYLIIANGGVLEYVNENFSNYWMTVLSFFVAAVLLNLVSVIFLVILVKFSSKKRKGE